MKTNDAFLASYQEYRARKAPPVTTGCQKDLMSAIRCDRCRVRLADLDNDSPYYRYNVGDRLPGRDGHAAYRLRDGAVTLCNAARFAARD